VGKGALRAVPTMRRRSYREMVGTLAPAPVELPRSWSLCPPYGLRGGSCL